jgi:Acetyltransferase (GNAT) domain
MTTGYLHPQYAASLGEVGVPYELARCGGWILRRPIPNVPYHDGMGCYPLFACQQWSQLHSDVEDLKHDLVSLSLVTDPFGGYDMRYLREGFDVLLPFKEHLVVDLDRTIDTFVSSHHRRYARKASREVHVERCHDPVQFIGEWTALYAALIRKHRIRGTAAFSRRSLATQLHVPGTVMFRAVHKGATVAMTLWYVQGKVGYYHLGASSDVGYDVHASFALFWCSIENFAATKLRWLNLGSGAGLTSDSRDGLVRFKRGWSTGTRTAYFCGRIFNQRKYAEAVRKNHGSRANYFPAYRSGEFG